MDRDAWLRERLTGIGGSDAPVVLGLSDWKRPFDLWQEKRGEAAPKVIESEPMRWGTVLEPAIRQEYAERTGEIVRRPTDQLRHPKLPFLICNPDGLTDSGRLVEVKTARTSEGWGEAGSADIPVAYLIQVQHNLIVTGLSIADVPALFGGQDFRIYEVPADPELQELIVGEETVFWERVKSGQPPEPITFADMKARYGRASRSETATATAEIEQAVDNLRRISAQQSELQALEEVNRALVMGFLGERDTLADLQGRPLVTWKASTTKRFDTATFKADAPDLYAQYVKAGEPSRRFLLK
jgi:putative phage-type endonuclease